MIINDNLVREFYAIDKALILDIYEFPNRTESLNNGFKLFHKTIGDGKLSEILLGVQSLDDGNYFTFAYYIPIEFISSQMPLIDTLILFVNKFGLRLRFGSEELLFITDKIKLMEKVLDNPFEIIETVGEQNIPCQLTLIHRDNFIGALNHQEIHYCFAINLNRYLTWAQTIDTKLLKIPVEWSHLINNVVDYLNPVKKVTLTVLKGVGAKAEKATLSGRFTDIEVPAQYERNILYINQLLEQLSEDEGIMIIPKFQQESCIFCGSTDTSSEHVFPKWTRNFFPEKEIDYPLVLLSDGQHQFSENLVALKNHKISTYGFTSTNVCVECNGTWMSQIENNVKNILKLDDTVLKHSIDDLDLDEFKINNLSKWMILKMILIFSKQNIPFAISSDDIKQLRDNIPDGFVCEILEANNYDLNFEIRSGIDSAKFNVPIGFNQDAFIKESQKFYVCVIQVGKFIFRTTYFQPENKNLRLETFAVNPKVIYPLGFTFTHRTFENSENLWNSMADNLKFRLLSNSFVLMPISI